MKLYTCNGCGKTETMKDDERLIIHACGSGDVALHTHTHPWFNECFAGHDVPAQIRALSERICRSYGIRGICDPMYIANVIGIELGLGDGLGNFKEK